MWPFQVIGNNTCTTPETQQLDNFRDEEIGESTELRLPPRKYTLVV